LIRVALVAVATTLASSAALVSAKDAAAAHAAPVAAVNRAKPPRATAAAQCTVEQTRSGWMARMADGRVLFDRWNPSRTGSSAFLAPSSIEVTSVTDGVSIVYTFLNKSSRAMRPLDLDLPVLQLPSSPQFMDASFLGTPQPIPTTATPWMGGVYPRDLYSPVAAMTWKGGAVGISLIYPVLDYRHDAAVVIRSSGSGKWKPVIGLNNSQIGDHWSTVLKHEASVPPGAQRVYRVEIRATTGSGWLETLEPYRIHFQRTYGAVRYARDGRSIAAVQTAMDDRQSVTNPDGWITEAGRPDLHGYDTVAAMLRQALVKYDRTILWSPTGLHRANVDRNYPFKFVSRWFDPVSTPTLRGAPASLATVNARSSKGWGLWWGHAAEVQAVWDSAEYWPVTMSDEKTLKIAKRELNLAVSTGARIIGLDAFTHHASPVWELHPWLRMMTSENPGVTFCTEGRNPDLMHAIAPTWVDAFGTSKYRTTNGSLIGSRFVLADWLLPGHETWAGVMWNRADREDLRTQPGGTARRTEIDRLRTLGFVPVLFGD